MREAEREITNARDKAHRGYYQNERESLGSWIHATDTDIIELRSALKELREFDFRSLYTELGVSPEIMRVDNSKLDEIKTKAKLISEIRPPPPPPVTRSSKTEDEIKMEAAKQRLKRDIHFDVHSRLGKKINTLAEIQNFEKEQRRAILADRTLSPDEQEERIELLNQEAARMKKELKSSVTVYEDD